jgi:hypothetical protein
MSCAAVSTVPPDLLTALNTVLSGGQSSRMAWKVAGSTLSANQRRRGMPGARGRIGSNGRASAE